MKVVSEREQDELSILVVSVWKSQYRFQFGVRKIGWWRCKIWGFYSFALITVSCGVAGKWEWVHTQYGLVFGDVVLEAATAFLKRFALGVHIIAFHSGKIRLIYQLLNRRLYYPVRGYRQHIKEVPGSTRLAHRTGKEWRTSCTNNLWWLCRARCRTCSLPLRCSGVSVG